MPVIKPTKQDGNKPKITGSYTPATVTTPTELSESVSSDDHSAQDIVSTAVADDPTEDTPSSSAASSDTEDSPVVESPEVEGSLLDNVSAILPDKTNADYEFKMLSVSEVNDKLLNAEQLQDITHEELEVLKFLKEAQAEGEMTDDSIAAYNKRINERIQQMPDSDYLPIIDKVIKDNHIPPDQQMAVKLDLLARMKQQQAVTEDFEAARSEFNQKMAQNEVEMQDMFMDMDYLELLEKISALIELCRAHHLGKAVKYYEDLKDEVESILHLSRLQRALPKIKNPYYIVTAAHQPTEYEREYKKFYKILENSSKYKFVPPHKLLESLELYLPAERKDDAKIFMFSLYRYINDNQHKMLEKNAVFLEGLFRIIYSLHLPETDPAQKLKDAEKAAWTEALYAYIDELKRLAAEYQIVLEQKQHKYIEKKRRKK